MLSYYHHHMTFSALLHLLHPISIQRLPLHLCGGSNQEVAESFAIQSSCHICSFLTLADENEDSDSNPMVLITLKYRKINDPEPGG